MIPSTSLDTILSLCNQLILSISEDWSRPDVKMQRMERELLKGQWEPEGNSFTAVCGKNGMAWAPTFPMRTILDPNVSDKKEGDMQAPAGIFTLGKAFGYDKAEEVKFKWPYMAITPTLEAIDDPDSKWYNQIIDTSKVTDRDWNSSEDMLRADGLYGWGLVINYNITPAIPGRGSCIFMHLWRGPGQGTEGCTAMSEENILTLLNWLKPESNPMLLQMPRPVLERWAEDDRLAAQFLEVISKS